MLLSPKPHWRIHFGHMLWNSRCFKGKMDQLHLDSIFLLVFYYPENKIICPRSPLNPAQPMLTCPIFNVGTGLKLGLGAAKWSCSKSSLTKLSLIWKPYCMWVRVGSHLLVQCRDTAAGGPT